MKYEDIKDFSQRCEEHKDHQTGMVSTGMLACRMQEEIDELREYIEQRTWVGLTDEDLAVCGDEDDVMLARYWERVCKEKNT
jgi:hypothetical protein